MTIRTAHIGVSRTPAIPFVLCSHFTLHTIPHLFSDLFMRVKAHLLATLRSRSRALFKCLPSSCRLPAHACKCPSEAADPS